MLHVRSDSFGENGRPGVGNQPGRPTTPPRGNSDPNDPNDPQREPGTQDRPGATPDRPQTPGTTRPATQSQAGNVKVALGPSWYVMSRADAIPMRGHSFDGEVAELERARGDVKYVAISCKINGKEYGHQIARATTAPPGSVAATEAGGHAAQVDRAPFGQQHRLPQNRTHGH